ncbi:MAG: tandem-95 repeat protein [Magnetococcales bacterium]|nr:tandem-95 repeat protein [Magnetococcales bacterium]
MLRAVNRLPEFIPFTENLHVEVGTTYTGRLPIRDEEGETNLTFRIVTNGEKGTATITDPRTGAFTYQPKPGFVGPDTFTFVINDGIGETTPTSVTMHVVNRLPEFLPPAENLIAQVGQPIQGVLPIKPDQTGETLTFRIVTQGSKGTITLDNPTTGAFTYRPNPGTFGPDTFTFAVSDGAGETDPLPMTIHVENRLPEFLPPAENIVAQVGSQAIQGVLPIKPDQTGETLTFRIVTPPTKGTLTLTNVATGTFTYQPFPGTSGPDTFTFAVSDGAGETAPMPMTIHVENRLPEFLPPTENIVAQVGSQAIQGLLPIKPDQTGETLTFRIVTQPTKGTLTLTNATTGAFTYQPFPGTSGPDTFSFSVSDGVGETAPMPMTIHVENKLPEFIPFTESIFVDAGQVFNGLLPIKSDQTGETLTFRIVTNGTKGTATLTNTATGAFSYRPNPGTTGPDTFSFAISDGVGETQPITMTLNIVNNRPQPVTGTLTVTAGQSVTGTFSIPNPEGDILTYRIVTQGLKGTATITDPATGTFSFAALSTASGADFFTFVVNDGVGDSDPVPINITINPATGANTASSHWGTLIWGQNNWSAGN